MIQMQQTNKTVKIAAAAVVTLVAVATVFWFAAGERMYKDFSAKKRLYIAFENTKAQFPASFDDMIAALTAHEWSQEIVLSLNDFEISGLNLDDNLRAFLMSATLYNKSAFDTDNKRMFDSTDLKLGNVSFLGADIYGDEELLAISIPQLTEGFISMPARTINTSINNSMLSTAIYIPEDYSDEVCYGIYTDVAFSYLNSLRMLKIFPSTTMNVRDYLQSTEYAYIGKQNEAEVYTIHIPADDVKRLCGDYLNGLSTYYTSAYNNEAASGVVNAVIGHLNTALPTDALVMKIFVQDDKITSVESVYTLGASVDAPECHLSLLFESGVTPKDIKFEFTMNGKDEPPLNMRGIVYADESTKRFGIDLNNIRVATDGFIVDAKLKLTANAGTNGECASFDQGAATKIDELDMVQMMGIFGKAMQNEFIKGILGLE